MSELVSHVEPPEFQRKNVEVTAGRVMITSSTATRMMPVVSSTSAVSSVAKTNSMYLVLRLPYVPKMYSKPGRNIMEPMTRGIQLVKVSALRASRFRSMRARASLETRPRFIAKRL